MIVFIQLIKYLNTSISLGGVILRTAVLNYAKRWFSPNIIDNTPTIFKCNTDTCIAGKFRSSQNIVQNWCRTLLFVLSAQCSPRLGKVASGEVCNGRTYFSCFRPVEITRSAPAHRLWGFLREPSLASLSELNMAEPR